ncbi:UNVERIFIED_CONTAM: hypothetical protein GTU68_029691, partial [Idotea baltica]|nr:hypothetical protein [Idotea baltica]
KIKYSAYLELAKPSILKLVLVTTALGYFLAKNEFSGFLILFYTLIGTALACGGAGALNHYIERDLDSKMKRTACRPIPSGLIAPNDALAFGILLVIFGTAFLVWQVNLLTGFLALMTAFLYVFVYTPLKRITWLNTFIGAIPGAIPPMGGWAAATGGLELGAWALFLILFVWQHPHFFAIAWMYRDDYKKAGFKMLPSIDEDGTRTFKQIIYYSVLLIPVSLLPTFLGLTSFVYAIGALIIGVLLLITGFEVSRLRTTKAAGKLLRGTVIYLPILFVLIILDFALIKT